MTADRVKPSRGPKGGTFVDEKAAAPSTATDLLREADKWTRAIVESAVDGIITIDETGTIEYINPAAERMFGYAPHEVLGRNVSVLMNPEDSAKHDDHLARYRSTGKRSIIGSIR